MNQTHAECSGYDFAAGQVTGIRGFRVDRFGRLMSASYGNHIWRPGENVAQCGRNRGVCSSEAHGCGFWGYHDGSLYGSGTLLVHGVIKGYGKTTIGTKGFRCEKAEIVALHMRGRFTRMAWVNLAVTLWCLAWGTADAFTGHWWGFAIEMALAVLNGGLLVFGLTRKRLSSAAAAKVRRNYPDVKFYSSIRAMKRAHPIDPTLEPNPETPGFWDNGTTSPRRSGLNVQVQAEFDAFRQQMLRASRGQKP